VVGGVQLLALFDCAVVAVVSPLPSSIAGGSTQRPSIFAMSIMNVSRSADVSLASRNRPRHRQSVALNHTPLGERAIASITLETDDDSVRRAITPTSPAVARRLTTMRRLRAAGIFTQIAIAPMLPNHPQHFADLAAEVSDRVIVDTYFDGDGARGRRSRALGIGELYERLGYADWFKPGAERELLAAMRARLGDDRVLFSRDGFNAV
jgi:hypothetical protein